MSWHTPRTPLSGVRMSQHVFQQLQIRRLIVYYHDVSLVFELGNHHVSIGSQTPWVAHTRIDPGTRKREAARSSASLFQKIGQDVVLVLVGKLLQRMCRLGGPLLHLLEQFVQAIFVAVQDGFLQFID